jgi:hypothetical protein
VISTCYDRQWLKKSSLLGECLAHAMIDNG